MGTALDPTRGVYDSKRAAALAGVPKSTLNYWARTELLVPSVAAHPHTRLWSWGDLLALRAIEWLRVEKPGVSQATPMRQIRRALEYLADAGVRAEEFEERARVAQCGRLFLDIDSSEAFDPTTRRFAFLEIAALIAPTAGGPNLLRPRPQLRIIPGKLSGEPHIEGTRIASASLYALALDGFSLATISSMYPRASQEAIAQAIDLERSLDRAA
jgi:DNA-binding transcriptional MerR regulator/uncharacterized protein (DUF433 family)